MDCTRVIIVCLASMLFSSTCVLSRPVQKRQSTQELDQEPLQQEENDGMLKFGLLSRSSGKYVTMHKNGSVFASGLPVQGRLDSSSQWYLHMTRDMYRLENVESRNYYLAMAHRDNVTILVAHNQNESFTLEMMMKQEGKLSGEGEIQNNTEHNDTNSTENSGSTLSLLVEWHIRSVDMLANNMMLVSDNTDCYLSFDYDGKSPQNLCSLPRKRNNLDIVFEPVF